MLHNLPQHRESAPLLAAKLFLPRPRAELVTRPRLLTRLQAALQRRLTLIAAPAGFGKTTLLAEWLNRFIPPGHPVAWLALDEGDSDPVQFLRYLITALQRIDVTIGETLLPRLSSAQMPPLEPLLTVLLNDLAHVPDKSILILDDYHTIESPQVHQMLNFLLDHLTPQLHLIIATRVDPPFPLARLRARGQLAELRAADMRFTRTEAADFLREVMAVDLAPADVAAVEARTEGWVAGLQLAGLSLQDVPPEQIGPFIDSFTGSHRFVIDYLADEVLASQPAHIQDFLFQTSILERFCASLCDAVVGTPEIPGQLLLEQLERANLFLVPLDATRGWYRYHHLFAQVLRERLAATATAAEQNELHRRAAVWFSADAGTDEAVHHFLAAQEWEQAANLIEQNGEALMLQGKTLTVGSWLMRVPRSWLDRRPFLHCLQGLVYFNTNQLQEAELCVEAGESALAKQVPSEQTRTLSGLFALLRSNIARARGDLLQVAALAGKALEELPAAQLAPRSAASLAQAQEFLASGDVGPASQCALQDALATVEAWGNLLTRFNSMLTWAEFQRCRGQLRPAVDTYGAAGQEAWASLGMETHPNSASYTFGLGAIVLELNELEAAEQWLVQGRTLIQQGCQAHADFITRGYGALIRLYQNRQRHAEARLVLDELQRVAQQRHFAPYLSGRIQALEAHVALVEGDLTAAVRWANAVTPNLPANPKYLDETEWLVVARVRLAQTQKTPDSSLLAPVLSYLDQLRANAEQSMRMDSTIQIETVRALVAQALGDEAEALHIIEGTLERAATAGYMRVFIEKGAPLAELLARGLQRKFNRPTVRSFAQEILKVMHEEEIAHAPSAGTRLSGSRVSIDGYEMLTAREMDVLRLLATGASNQAIAQALVVETGTVKRHVSNIMEKLQAKSRLAAVARARELELL